MHNEQHDLNCVWAKTLAGKSTYPVTAHSLDTGAVILVLFEGGWVTPQAKAHMARTLDVPVAELPATLATLAASHDIGKATPQFQAKAADHTVGGCTVAEHLAELPARIAADARSVDDAVAGRHAVVSGVAMKRHVPDGYAPDVVAGHHGCFDHNMGDWDPLAPARMGVKRPLVGGRSLFDGSDAGPWADMWDELHRCCVEAFGAELPAIRNLAAVPQATEQVVFADWVASQEHMLDANPQRALHDPAGYVRDRIEFTKKELRVLLGDPVPDTTNRTFAEKFPKFDAPNPVQQAVAELPTAPGITIVAAAMGTGKTEAALQRSFNGTTGVYVAMPTGATTMGMFSRLREFCADQIPEGDTIAATILHHNSQFNPFFSEPNLEAVQADSAKNWAEAIAASSWLRSRHRALLAPIAAGTIDQLLQGVLPHRYGFMKVAAVAGRTVILDEVHAYDAYTVTLVARLVEWLAFLGCDVFVLSATLPGDAATMLVNAHRDGAAAARSEQRPAPVIEAPAAYPYVWHVPAAMPDESIAVELPTDEEVLELEYVDGNTVEEIAAAVLAAIADGPPMHTGVFVNTVDKCQKVGRLIAEALPDADVVVLHSWMTAGQREEVTADVGVRFGKNRTDRPERHQILVSTQVAEQSLDLDVDVMVTQLAPIASLLQRSGRLWRHDRPNRPCARRLIVTRAGKLDRYPYGTAAVRRTWELVLNSEERTQISVPGDVQELVDIGYDTTPVEYLNEAAEREVHRDAATRAAWPSPHDVVSPVEYTRRTDIDGLLTRLGADTDTVLVVGDAPYAWSGEIPERPDAATQEQLLRCTVSLSRQSRARTMLNLCGESPYAQQWEQCAPSLRDIKILDLDDMRDFATLDPTFGLEIHT